jgi:hypothetical protein
MLGASRLRPTDDCSPLISTRQYAELLHDPDDNWPGDGRVMMGVDDRNHRGRGGKLVKDETDSLAALRRDVEALATEIGPRNIDHYQALESAAEFVSESLKRVGYQPTLQRYEARGKRFANIEAELRGGSRGDEAFIVGAHYDTRRHSPGADDNASGIAALLALARHFANRPAAGTLRFVAFTNEERPFLRTSKMGSRVYATACRKRNESITGMVSLECLGYASDRVGSQRLSLFGYLAPRTGNFAAFVANRRSRALMETAARAFSDTPGSVHAERFVMPQHFPGAWSSDHWSFWKEGYPAFMVTDTAPLRNPHYHKQSDTPETLNYEWLAAAVTGLERAVDVLANGGK